MWDYNIATDTPPLWHVKKKHTLYYNGVGRGSMPKLLLQASVLGTPDSSHSRKSVEACKDVYAWLLSLEAPPYPKVIDQQLAQAGKPLFNEHCSGCHGTYGPERDTYPNKVVNLDVIKTADWVIDMGPEGGSGGGQVVATGTPEDIAAKPESMTGRYLKRLFEVASLRQGKR